MNVIRFVRMWWFEKIECLVGEGGRLRAGRKVEIGSSRKLPFLLHLQKSNEARLGR